METPDPLAWVGKAELVVRPIPVELHPPIDAFDREKAGDLPSIGQTYRVGAQLALGVAVGGPAPQEGTARFDECPQV